MLEYIHLKYFQSHVDTRIDFCSATTAITGISMHGKTAIARGLKLLRKNRPSGTKFIYRYSKEPAVVEAGVDGHVVRHTKSKKALDDEGNKAIYYIKYPDGTEKEFKAFGTDVPEEVTRILNISDISIQSQLDAYLLVISSAGEIAKTINRITGIDVADEWIKDIKKNIKIFKAKKDAIEDNKVILEKDIKEYDGIDEIYKKTIKAEELQNEWDYKTKCHSEIIDTIAFTESAMAKLKKTKSDHLLLSGLLKKINTIENKIEEINDRKCIMNKIEKTKTRLKLAKKHKDYLTPMLKRLEEIIKIEKFKKEVDQIMLKYSNHSEKLSNAKNKLKTQKDIYINHLVKMGKCFVCGNDTKEELIRGQI